MYLPAGSDVVVESIEAPVASDPVMFSVKALEFGFLSSTNDLTFVKNMKMELQLDMVGPVRLVRRPLLDMKLTYRQR